MIFKILKSMHSVFKGFVELCFIEKLRIDFKVFYIPINIIFFSSFSFPFFPHELLAEICERKKKKLAILFLS